MIRGILTVDLPLLLAAMSLGYIAWYGFCLPVRWLYRRYAPRLRARMRSLGRRGPLLVHLVAAYRARRRTTREDSR